MLQNCRGAQLIKELCSCHNPQFILPQEKSNKCRISVVVGINVPRFWIVQNFEKKLRFQFSISFSNHADFEQLLRIFSCYGLSWRTTFKALCSSHNPPFILAQRKSNKCRISVGVGINVPRFWIVQNFEKKLRFQFSISFSNHADFEQLLRIFSCYGLSWRTTFKALCSSHNPPFILAQRKSNKCRISVGVGINVPRFWILPTWNMEIFTNTERNM